MESNIKNIISNINNSSNNKDIVSKFNRGIYQLHPYHLVEVSPWPIFTAFTLFGLTFNTVLVMHGYIGIVYVIFINIILVIYSMGLWFRDVVSEASYLGNHTIAVRHGINVGYILFVVSEGMFFLGIFWAYAHSALAPTVELGGMWPPMGIVDVAIGPLELPLLNTIILLASGATITYSHHTLIAGKRSASLYSLLITVLLALIFTICQYVEYVNAGFTINDGVYGSTFFFGTGFHGLHVLIGGIMLSVSLWRMYAYHLTETHHVGYETSILYWHFVDLVWLFLFVLFYWWGS